MEIREGHFPTVVFGLIERNLFLFLLFGVLVLQLQSLTKTKDHQISSLLLNHVLKKILWPPIKKWFKKTHLPTILLTVSST